MGRILGIDPGEKRVGLALSDPQGIIASPLGQIEFQNQEQLISQIKELCQKHQVEEIVLGYPLRTTGRKGQEAEKVEELAEVIRQKTGLKVHLWDERLTTQQAEKELLQADLSRKKRKKLRDQLSACFMLDSFLLAQKQKR